MPQQLSAQTFGFKCRMNPEANCVNLRRISRNSLQSQIAQISCMHHVGVSVCFAVCQRRSSCLFWRRGRKSDTCLPNPKPYLRTEQPPQAGVKRSRLSVMRLAGLIATSVSSPRSVWNGIIKSCLCKAKPLWLPPCSHHTAAFCLHFTSAFASCHRRLCRRVRL